MHFLKLFFLTCCFRRMIQLSWFIYISVLHAPNKLKRVIARILNYVYIPTHKHTQKWKIPYNSSKKKTPHQLIAAICKPSNGKNVCLFLCSNSRRLKAQQIVTWIVIYLMHTWVQLLLIKVMIYMFEMNLTILIESVSFISVHE